VDEITFEVKDAPEGGYTASSLGESIFTEADSVDELRKMVWDAVHCHFDKGRTPPAIRLRFIREEIISA
jgi:hypothetical protein